MKNIKGFTLSELTTVIVIVGILAAWAMPNSFGATAKAKLSEYKLVLENIAYLQEIYYQEMDAYGKTLEDIVADIPKSKYFNYSMEGDLWGFVARATVIIDVKGPGKKSMKGLSVSINQDDVHGGDEALRKLTNW